MYESGALGAKRVWYGQVVGVWTRSYLYGGVPYAYEPAKLVFHIVTR